VQNGNRFSVRDQRADASKAVHCFEQLILDVNQTQGKNGINN